MKRIALIFPGSLGRTDSDMYVPAHVDLLCRLSRKFEITAYTLIKPDNDRRNFRWCNAEIKYVSARYNDPTWKKVYSLYSLISNDHKLKPFGLFHGFKAIPCGIVAILLSRRHHRPSVLSLQGGEAANLPTIGYGDMRKQPLRSLTLRTCIGTDHLTMLTNFQHESMKKFGLLRTDVKIIPYGATEEFFIDSGLPGLLPPYQLLHVGHLNAVKDQKTLLRAFQLISGELDCRLRIIGADYQDGELQRLCKQLQIVDRVEFLGQISHKDLPRYYRESHLMLHSSLFEGQGVVVSEAMASGLPVCGTNVGLIADLSGISTMAVPIRDHSEMARRAVELLRNSEMYFPLRATALEWAGSHNAQWTADQFEKLYGSVG